jgi:hypothetical protein
MVGDDALRARAAQVRDRLRGIRAEVRRHSKEPQWDLVRDLVASPLHELRKDVEQELARKSSQRGQLVPIDRDPVPRQFAERVRQYYERLGSGQ